MLLRLCDELSLRGAERGQREGRMIPGLWLGTLMDGAAILREGTRGRDFFFFFLFRASLVAYGCSQVRGRVGVVAAGLCHSHIRSKPPLQPTPQLAAMPDP